MLHFLFPGRCEVALMLLANHADRKLLCDEGSRPFDLAHKWGHIECREICKYLVPLVRDVKVSG